MINEMERRALRPPGSHPSLVLLEPCFPAYCACRLLWAGIASLTQGPDHFARQKDRENGPVHVPLLEPDPRQLFRGVDLWTAHIRQATGGASLDDLNQVFSHFLLGHGLEQQVRRQSASVISRCLGPIPF